jgi:hypothetical protein
MDGRLAAWTLPWQLEGISNGMSYGTSLITTAGGETSAVRAPSAMAHGGRDSPEAITSMIEPI